MLVRLDHVASVIVNANDGRVCMAVTLCVADSIAVLATKSHFHYGYLVLVMRNPFGS